MVLYYLPWYLRCKHATGIAFSLFYMVMLKISALQLAYHVLLAVWVLQSLSLFIWFFPALSAMVQRPSKHPWPAWCSLQLSYIDCVSWCEHLIQVLGGVIHRSLICLPKIKWVFLSLSSFRWVILEGPMHFLYFFLAFSFIHSTQ